MDWITAIKEIQKAQEDDRLVIFVGAGVSKNSGVPAWWDLIKKFADELGYSRSDTCVGSIHPDRAVDQRGCSGAQRWRRQCPSQADASDPVG